VDSYSVYGPSKMLNPMAGSAPAAGLFIIVMTARAPRYGSCVNKLSLILLFYDRIKCVFDCP
jgi:hypothetical protein